MADNIKPFFTYVNDNDIDSFLENSNQYINNVSFLGTSYQIVAKNKIYGNVRSDWNENDNSKQSYIIGKPDVVEKSYFDSAYSYNPANSGNKTSYSYFFLAADIVGFYYEADSNSNSTKVRVNTTRVIDTTMICAKVVDVAGTTNYTTTIS